MPCSPPCTLRGEWPSSRCHRRLLLAGFSSPRTAATMELSLWICLSWVLDSMQKYEP
uniref:Uncharacterized protein n=1 Tax=Arundo donax TaxID=35708 RepID=A0A0A8ZJ98_ARUDO